MINIIENVNYDYVSELLIDKNIVALFQGKSEAGQRALGNRSLLFDPRVIDGKDIVNRVKKRENFRPFAGSILLEYANEWFNMIGLEESPYMCYSLDCLEHKSKYIPGIIHVDNTSRIQTLTKDQNFHFYNLIESFYKKTSVPILLNTSFNLAGEPLVETVENAIDTFYTSDINYLYFPELSYLITKK
jgi:carbamoyltransferase